jgi:quercetin dioxygenase-like cupin family protein
LRRASPFRTWNGVDRHALFPGVAIHAIGGEQVLMCHVVYEPGTTVARHSHPQAEQVMWIVDGSVTMTVGDETKELRAGDVVVVNRGVEHELHSDEGMRFVEALAPVPRDHVPDPERDLVLGEQGDSLHVAR